MSSVVISGDTSGAITLSAPAVAGTNTITLPAATGTVNLNGPAFSAYKSGGDGDQSLTNATFVKITFPTEEFDTNSNYASSTFTPTVAGYYQVSSCVDYGSSSLTRAMIAIYKNGSEYKYAGNYVVPAFTEFAPAISSVVYCNGTTDYIEIYGRADGSTRVAYGGGTAITWFNATLVRGA